MSNPTAITQPESENKAATLQPQIQHQGSFESFDIPESLKTALKKMNYQAPTPVQAQAIPAGIEGRDVIASAQTGTGKTAAFCIPLVTKVIADPNYNGLILTPTRELAAQIEEVLRQLLQNNRDVNLALLIGGMSMRNQFNDLRRGPQIVIATPGRLIDHLERGSIHLDAASLLVLDEADRMLDMGFEPQLKEIMHHLPENRQTMMFSATFPPDIQKMTRTYMKNPVQVKVGENSQPAKLIKQIACEMRPNEKNDRLMDEINNRQDGAVLVFARTKQRTEKVTKFLMLHGFKVDYIHGDRTQRQRMDVIEDFRNGRCKVLIATDVAARGLDISNIRHVINYDMPQTPEDYVHRIGRTGRAGVTGEAVSFICGEDRPMWRAIQKLMGQKSAGSKGMPPAEYKKMVQSENTGSVVDDELKALLNDDEPQKSFRRSEPRRNNRPTGRYDGTQRAPQGEGGFERRAESGSRPSFRKPRESGGRDRRDSGQAQFSSRRPARPVEKKFVRWDMNPPGVAQGGALDTRPSRPSGERSAERSSDRSARPARAGHRFAGSGGARRNDRGEQSFRSRSY